MPPVTQARRLADAADQIRHLSVYLKKGGDTELAFQGLRRQLDVLKDIHASTVFTATHSYKNLAKVRLCLSNAAAAIAGHIDRFEDYIYKLEDAPRDDTILMALALMAPELKTIPFAPVLKDNSVQTISVGSRIPTLDNLDTDD